MSNRFPIEFFQELVKKQMIRDDIEDIDITLVDNDVTEDVDCLDDTVPERVVTRKF